MKKYRKREKPFDIKVGETSDEWSSVEDSFPENEDYLVVHLGWIYGKKRTRLSLNKIENIYKLSAYYYHANVKKELPHCSVEKSAVEIHQIFVDAHLNPDQDHLEIEDDLPNYYINEEEIVIDEEEELIWIDFELDAFINNLEDIIEDSIDGIENENDEVEESMGENVNGTSC
ncbi:hypothetical protein C1646_753611 [Rhizophagus diaphanus]|nr:hypothetical protein C1646_753611 [Rhizophagus diaphanus] [Rhizophagus sp. MUCL 43196]